MNQVQAIVLIKHFRPYLQSTQSHGDHAVKDVGDGQGKNENVKLIDAVGGNERNFSLYDLASRC